MSPFCGNLSALARNWVHRDMAAAALDPVSFEGGYRAPPELMEIVARRGIADPADYFFPTLRAYMPDPSSMQDMDAAVDRFVRAIDARERIAIYGDYDVDGASSVALVTRYLRMVGVDDSFYYVPDRLKEGYGANVPAMARLREQGADLLMLVDSGTVAHEPIEAAVSLGMDVVVIDHHEPKEGVALPRALVINPKRVGEDGSLAELCTGGLVFLFLAGVNRRLRESGWFARSGVAEPRLADLSGIAALATVCDVMKLRGFNRALVVMGLRHMSCIPGMAALLRLANEDRGKKAAELGKTHVPLDFGVYACGFAIGPCINATGRIGDTMIASSLLVTDDPAEADRLAEFMFRTNKERQAIQESIVNGSVSAMTARAGDEGSASEGVAVVYDPEWHPGVVGIAAGKIKDRFDMPAVIVGRMGKGSGRSVKGFNIGQAFMRAHEAGLLLKGGGHAMAGGLTIDPARIDDFRVFLCEQARGLEKAPTKVDAIFEVGGISLDVARSFALMEPFGTGNPSPVVAVVGGVLENAQVRGKGTISGTLRSTDGSQTMKTVMFGMLDTPMGDAFLAAEGHRVDVVGNVSINDWNKRQSVELKVSDFMVGPETTISY